MEGLEVNRTFWQGKRVFVTGHTGFKGSWLCRWLVRLGASVTGYALAPPTQPNLFDLLGFDREIVSLLADIRDAHLLREKLVACAPDVVLHMAAQSLVYESFLRPVETYETNVTGTANLLEAVRACPAVRAVVVVTSDKCYELQTGVYRHREGDALGGMDPYSASKACAEFVVAGFRSSFFSAPKRDASSAVAVATARAGNVIGGGDFSPHRLVPDAVIAFASHKPLLLRNPAAVRPWQYVLDPLRAYLMLAQRLYDGGQAFASAWNFGPPESHEITVEALVQEFAETWGDGATWEADRSPRAFDEAMALRLNSERAQRELGWSPRMPLVPAIRATAQWYRSHLSGANGSPLVDADIANFEKAAAT
jgi:CDP-glucose 4,6-dehydratase